VVGLGDTLGDGHGTGVFFGAGVRDATGVGLSSAIGMIGVEMACGARLPGVSIMVGTTGGTYVAAGEATVGWDSRWV
jgi:hypothetical protein